MIEIYQRQYGGLSFESNRPSALEEGFDRPNLNAVDAEGIASHRARRSPVSSRGVSS